MQNESSLFTAAKAINHALPRNEIIFHPKNEPRRFKAKPASDSNVKVTATRHPEPRETALIECQIEFSQPSIISLSILLIKFRYLI